TMRHARLRRGDRGDFSGIEMNAMADHGARREHSAFFIDVGVVARAHIKVVHFLQLLAVFRQVCLQIGFEPRGQLRGSTHHFFRTGNGETGTERVLKPAFLGPMPFPTRRSLSRSEIESTFFGWSWP